MSLLPRFFDPTEGSIRIDGLDLREVTVESLRKQIAIVTQDTILFDDTVFNNIAYGQPGIDPQRVYAVASSAYASEFIEAPARRLRNTAWRGRAPPERRPAPADRDRAGIAQGRPDSCSWTRRHLTSTAKREILVQRALSNLIHGRTVIVSAHRFSTIRSADSILVIDDGRIVDRGRHESLVRSCDLYRRLVELQSVGA